MRLFREGWVQEVDLLAGSFESVTFLLPQDFPSIPAVGEQVELLLDTRNGPLPAAVKADVREVARSGDKARLVCAFRSGPSREVRQAQPVRERTNRRAAFRVSPKPGQQVAVKIATDTGNFEGWVLNVSAVGMKLATRSKQLQSMRLPAEVRLTITIPGHPTPLEADGTIVRTECGEQPHCCGIKFSFPESHQKSEIETALVHYVMRRQREVIQLMRERGE